MLHRGANYRVQGLAQGPVRQSTGSRSHVRLRNHFRRCQMSRGRTGGQRRQLVWPYDSCKAVSYRRSRDIWSQTFLLNVWLDRDKNPCQPKQ